MSKTATKRVSDNLERGLWTPYGDPRDGYYAGVWYDLGAVALSAEELEDTELGGYVIEYWKEYMPPFNAQRFHRLSELIIAMRLVQPDLRKWRLVELED